MEFEGGIGDQRETAGSFRRTYTDIRTRLRARQLEDFIDETIEYSGGSWDSKKQIYSTPIPEKTAGMPEIFIQQRLQRYKGIKDSLVSERFVKKVVDQKGKTHFIEMVREKDGLFREIKFRDRLLNLLKEKHHKTGRLIEYNKPGEEPRFILRVENHAKAQRPTNATPIRVSI